MRALLILGLALLLAPPALAQVSTSPETSAERRAERLRRQAERKARPPSQRPVRTIVIPGASFNTDDGLGVGFIASIRRLPPAYLLDLARREVEAAARGEELSLASYALDATSIDGGRPWLWDITAINILFFKPRPNAWGINWLVSWFPEPDGRSEVSLLVHSIGWNWAWYAGLGNGTVTDLRRDREDDEVEQLWHRYGLYDVTLGLRLDRELDGPLSLTTAFRIDYDTIQIREGTLLAQEVAAGLVHAPLQAFGATGEGGFRLDSTDQRHDPTRGGILRGGAWLTASSAGLYGRLTLDARGYVGLGPGAPVVLAANVVANLQAGQTPFFELGVLGDPAPKPRLVTGSNALRSRRRGRLRGPLALLLLSEVRFRPPGFNVGRSRLRVEPVIFADAARVDTWELAGGGLALHPGLGGGLRAILNEQLVVHLDVGVGPDAIIRPDGVADQKWVVGGYASLGQFF